MTMLGWIRPTRLRRIARCCGAHAREVAGLHELAGSTQRPCQVAAGDMSTRPSGASSSHLGRQVIRARGSADASHAKLSLQSCGTA
jgi:hypothetical protein